MSGRPGRVSPLSHHPPVPPHQTVDGVGGHRQQGQAGYSDGDDDGEPHGVGSNGGGGGGAGAGAGAGGGRGGGV